MIIAAQTEPIQWVSALMVLISLVGIAYIAKTDKETRLWLIALAVWVLHGAIFYATLFLERAYGIEFGVRYTTWSSELRLHGYLTIAGYLITWIYIQRLRRGKS